MQGNGGIASWTKKFLKTFPDDEFKIYSISNAPDKDFTLYRNNLDRLYHGAKAMIRCYRDAKKVLKQHPEIQIMHTTTSSGMGSIRDYLLAKLCHKHNVKCIMHCRFGTVKEKYESKDIWGKYFVKAVKEFDQTWVLDNRSATFLKSIPEISDRIYLTPNSIAVPDTCDFKPKDYHNIGFVGNVVETKGVFELVQAVAESSADVNLTIAGPGSANDIAKVKALAGAYFGEKIKYVGKLPNDKAVDLINSLDVVALPTYYSGEAFPISILEAMSRGKLVLSCPRAAIPDMLTANDGSRCGVLVAEKSKDEIVQAIDWIVSHKEECDEMCKKAYEKVKTAYRMEVVYDIYRENYKRLIAHDSN